METPEHDAQLDDPAGELEEDQHDQEELTAEDREEPAGAPEAPTGP